MTTPPERSTPLPANPESKPSTGNAFTDEEEEWRHAPVAPRDEKNPMRSLGEAIGDVVTGSESKELPQTKP